jgi:hypothetical protein
MLEKELNFYISHQKELIESYNGKFLVIVGEDVVGVFESEIEAYNESKVNYTPGSFLIQRCSPGNTDYSTTFYSRVSFS